MAERSRREFYRRRFIEPPIERRPASMRRRRQALERCRDDCSFSRHNREIAEGAIHGAGAAHGEIARCRWPRPAVSCAAIIRICHAPDASQYASSIVCAFAARYTMTMTHELPEGAAQHVLVGSRGRAIYWRFSP